MHERPNWYEKRPAQEVLNLHPLQEDSINIVFAILGRAINPEDPKAGINLVGKHGIGLGYDVDSMAPAKLLQIIDKELFYYPEASNDEVVRNNIKRFLIRQALSQRLWYSSDIFLNFDAKALADMARELGKGKEIKPLPDLSDTDLDKILDTRAGRMRYKFQSFENWIEDLKNNPQQKRWEAASRTALSYKNLFAYTMNQAYGELSAKEITSIARQTLYEARKTWQERFFWLSSIGGVSGDNLIRLFALDVGPLEFGSFMDSFGSSSMTKFFPGIFGEIFTGLQLLEKGYQVRVATEEEEPLQVDLVAQKDNDPPLFLQIKGTANPDSFGFYDITSRTPRDLVGYKEENGKLLRRQAHMNGGLAVWVHAPTNVTYYMESKKMDLDLSRFNI